MAQDENDLILKEGSISVRKAVDKRGGVNSNKTVQYKGHWLPGDKFKYQKWKVSDPRKAKFKYRKFVTVASQQKTVTSDRKFLDSWR